MAYIDQYNNAVDQTFRNRVIIAIVIKSISVILEPTSKSNYNKRISLAHKIANDPTDMATKMAYIIGADPDAIDAPDSMLDSLVDSIWDTVAGIEPI